ncbi:DUF885 domain-containing protein [Mangrovihabitans endophyticus]|uniref:DUF885 domain-containing protein n=1 Tax=Mangrovihabitans endophyticus TaxID=1751298 RepID=A0A8J3BY54_9ACTN|nr:DUF885 domain-containing protein [Mangrovihabitans endophyticus]GGK91801.1 hypothetical protein GCM10012284_27140 [Mangrovihabitans endophyticus]
MPDFTPAEPETSDFPVIAERIVDALLESDPLIAATAGDHRFDDRLPDHSAGAVAARAAMVRDAADTLAGLNTDGLGPQDHVDHQMLSALVERELFELSDVREPEWNPLVHNPGPLLHSLLARPFAPVEERLVSLGGRLAAVPDALATARVVLHDMPRVHVETAVGQFAGVATLIRDQVPRLLDAAPELRSAVEPVSAAAQSALGDFCGWLRARLDTGDPGRDPRLGRPMWEARLWHTLDTELPAAEVLELAWREFDEAGARLRDCASELVGGPATDDTARAALDMLGREHPSDETIVDLARLSLRETTDFVRAHDLVSLIDDPCVIEEMPEFARGVAVAYCDPPGPLEKAEVPTFYCIAPTPDDWPAERAESFYREYNDHMVRNLTVHEAMPGHFLQLAHARRFRGGTRVRSLGWSGPFVEGWAVYAEDLMAEAGFGGLPIRLQQLKMRLRMSLNAIIDQLVHCEQMPEREAMALMTERGFQEAGEAAGKWRRALLTSTQLSTYFVGYTEVAAIAAARPFGATPRAWHDAMLSHGSPPPRHLRTLLGV